MSKRTIPDKHYVGMTKRQGTMPLGFITPWGTDKAALKRMATVDSWAGVGRADAFPTSVIDNVPMLGFKLTSDIRVGSQGSVDKWRIEDPRGFELEITSANFAEVLSEVTIERGEILEQCMWGREGGQNVLMTVESEEYKIAVEMTKYSKSSLVWKDAKIGNMIALQNGIKGQYLGKMYAVTFEKYSRNENDQSFIKIIPDSMHVILSDFSHESPYYEKTKHEIHFLKTAKLSAILDSSIELSTDDAAELVNSKLNTDTIMLSSSNNYHVVLASPEKITEDNLKTVLEDSNESATDKEIWKDRYYHKSRLFVQLNDATRRFGMIEGNYNGKQEVILVDSSTIGSHKLNAMLQASTYRRHRDSDPKFSSIEVNVDIADVEQVHRIALEVSGKSVYKSYL